MLEMKVVVGLVVRRRRTRRVQDVLEKREHEPTGKGSHHAHTGSKCSILKILVRVRRARLIGNSARQAGKLSKFISR